ncbi:hypothetical protein M9Q43_08315 [Flavobacterium sp. HXWNR29]|uniref:hypothetical protein n=1 Tax=Flavobacterium odoriferum TaxID=2946604 RepID=UPI0021CB9389|nr:hypothetical protein [Flavobacterium sp. HXWNR29]MCU4189165.1 hypothetical protein [Flavobacterium sp. HXWNR29]
MKTNYLSLKLALFLVLPFALLQMFTSCSKNIEFENSNVVPAARGDISVKKDKNNNYNFKLEISYLAEPERLQPPKKYYVVWLSSEQNQIPLNIGQIVGTSKLHVKFESVSSSKPKRIFVTAEDDVSTQYPGQYGVLETDKF